MLSITSIDAINDLSPSQVFEIGVAISTLSSTGLDMSRLLDATGADSFAPELRARADEVSKEIEAIVETALVRAVDGPKEASHRHAA